MTNPTRFSMLTVNRCGLCASQGVDRKKRIIRHVIPNPTTGGFIEVPGPLPVLYCGHCDGPLATWGCSNPNADEGATP